MADYGNIEIESFSDFRRKKKFELNLTWIKFIENDFNLLKKNVISSILAMPKYFEHFLNFSNDFEGLKSIFEEIWIFHVFVELSSLSAPHRLKILHDSTRRHFFFKLILFCLWLACFMTPCHIFVLFKCFVVVVEVLSEKLKYFACKKEFYGGKWQGFRIKSAILRPSSCKSEEFSQIFKI